MNKVIVLGAAGKMGSEVVKAVIAEPELSLVGMVGFDEEDIRILDGKPELNEIYRTADLNKCIEKVKPNVAVDFTHPQGVLNNIQTCLKHHVHILVGTTGIAEENYSVINKMCLEMKTNAAVIPNFSIGAVLMMRCCKEIAKYMPDAEIIELHHDKKADAPSGTAVKTAEFIAENRTSAVHLNESETIPGARGARTKNVYIHSVRLPSLFAHQEVIFSAPGQTLTVRHDTFNRECYMPGVIAAVKALPSKQGFTYGLDELLGMGK